MRVIPTAFLAVASLVLLLSSIPAHAQSTGQQSSVPSQGVSDNTNKK